MDKTIRIFKSPQCKAQYYAAYAEMLKKWPVSYEELTVPTRFGDTHVIASGQKNAPALVLLHSAGSGAMQWYRNVEMLSQSYRTYAVDVIGEVNKSSTTQIISTRQEFVAWMIELFNGLHIERADMAGNSFGGFLAFNTALYSPERVRKVVMISPAATFMPIWAWYWHIAFPYKFGYLIGSKRIILCGFEWIWQDFPRDDFFTRYTELGKTCGFPSNHLMPPVFSDAELKKINTPMLLLIGDHEVIYSPQSVIRRATSLVDRLKAEIIPNANHSAQVTAPNAVNQKILDFLAN